MISGLIKAAATRLLASLLRMGFGDVVDSVLAFLEKQADTETERMRIRSQTTIEVIRAEVARYNAEQETRRHLASEGTVRQKSKMNYGVFWVIIIAALGPGVLNLWSIWAYNIFFWKDGIWPQDWYIAEFPPQSERWINMSIEWLFDPYGIGSTIGSATVAGLVAGRRK